MLSEKTLHWFPVDSLTNVVKLDGLNTTKFKAVHIYYLIVLGVGGLCGSLGAKIKV